MNDTYRHIPFLLFPKADSRFDAWDRCAALVSIPHPLHCASPASHVTLPAPHQRQTPTLTRTPHALFFWWWEGGSILHFAFALAFAFAQGRPIHDVNQAMATASRESPDHRCIQHRELQTITKCPAPTPWAPRWAPSPEPSRTWTAARWRSRQSCRLPPSASPVLSWS